MSLPGFRSFRSAVVVAFGLASAASAQCLDWQTFPRTEVDHPGTAQALVVHDDGTGAALYVGGAFYGPGSGWGNVGVRRWNGDEWSAVGATQLAGTVTAFARFDDGMGTALYAAGRFMLSGDTQLQNRVARWDGATWQSIGNFDGEVSALAVYDDGSGAQLHVGGAFTQEIGGPILRRVARWNGASWSPLGGGIGSWPQELPAVYAFAVHDDGAGPQLYVGGGFVKVDADNIDARHVARWNGTAWSALAGGPLNNRVFALASYDSGSGASLYLGGLFTLSVPNYRGAVRWTGSAYEPVLPAYYYDIGELAVLDDGAGPRLYIGARGYTAARVFRYDGTAAVDIGMQGAQSCGTFTSLGVAALATFDEGAGPRVFAAGVPGLGAVDASVTRWDGASGWDRVGTPLTGLDGGIAAMQVHDDGTGPAVWLGGNFCRAGDVQSRGMTRWNGVEFEAVGLPQNAGSANALGVHDDGTGVALYAGAGGSVYRRDAGAWTGIGWSPLAGIWEIASYDAGSGPRLYVGGYFTTFGGVASPNIVAWDGSAWHPVGTGVNGTVYAMAVYDDGSGPKLYVAGSFTLVSGLPAAKIARWDGATWTPVGGGLSADAWALRVHDDGTGAKLYVGGDFLTAGTTSARRIASWDGSAWSALGEGLDALVTSIVAFDDGSGPKLHAGGSFTHSGAAAMAHVARFDGTAWRALGGGIAGNLTSLSSFDDGTGSGAKLFVGGYFTGTPTYASPGLAAWRGCAGEIERFCFGDGTVASCPCSNHGLAFRGCDNSRNTGGARLNATGTVSPDTIELYVAGEPPSAATLFFQGDVVLTAPQLFGDGLRCAGGSLKRMYTTQASSGSVAVPPSGGPTISARSAALGDPLVPGSVRAYQTWYRDSDPVFCTAPAGNAWNLSNAVRIVW